MSDQEATPTHRPRVRVGIASGLGHVVRYQEWARAAEAQGFDLIGYGDSQCLLPELTVALAATATVTERVLLAPTVTNPVTRHPAVAASAFGALQQLSGGRARYCAGTGDSAVWTVGERPAKVDDFAEYCQAFRALVSGRTARWRGKDLHMEWDVPPVPLWMSAEGPRMLRLAGQLADGVLLGAGLTEDIARDHVGRVRAAAVEHGRDPDDIEIWAFAKLYLCDDEERAWHDLAWTLAASANHVFRRDMASKYVPDRHVDALHNLLASYAGHEHNALVHPATHNASLVRDHDLCEFLGPRFLVAGSASRIVERLDELASWGITNVFTSAMFGDPFDYAARLADEVLPALR